MSVHPLFDSSDGERRIGPAGRAATLSAQIVAEVREALNEKRLKPGDVIGSEKDIAKRRALVWEAERLLARDVARPIIFYTRGATCRTPRVKGLTLMVNSLFDGWRMEDVWLDR